MEIPDNQRVRNNPSSLRTIQALCCLSTHGNPRAITWNRRQTATLLPTKLPSHPPPPPIVKLTDDFAIFKEEGEVFQWGDKLPQQPPTPSDDDGEFDKEWFRWVAFNEPVKRWPTRLPESLDYEPRKRPPPPIKELSTGGRRSVAVSKSGQLFIWGYKSSKWPEIEDCNDRNSATLEEARITGGNPDETTALKIKHAAAGGNHVVALAVDASLWSVGNGL
ncbi:uncharacterized protein BO97DRAFT_428073 [Aspergillus homomorphus CBS 101889]|uniref:RCC1/BLIP-II n=1 Tax=Aspergillus homomorphus (strain CBS 101889) TaxID=1450537 RepID=A0A395HLX0_ASPHC|nr:hypothetical protein BO97DRAFT_428073 [Aspergillus homomorphus CBS 101889]RAL08760.1 hypothetical protein BO97DRAFT_428073 [Aspergillus homomorphus CBS 101889]